MKFTPYISIPFGKFHREVTRAEAAEILHQARRSKASDCFRVVPGLIRVGPLSLFTRNV